MTLMERESHPRSGYSPSTALKTALAYTFAHRYRRHVQSKVRVRMAAEMGAVVK